MINNVVIVGRLVKDAEIRYTKNNKAVTYFTLATQRPYKNANGDYESDFIKFVAFDKIGETINQHVSKGDMITVRGRIQNRSYEDKDGNKQYTTEVIVENIGFLFNKKNALNSEKTVQNEVKEEVKEVDPFAEFADEIADEDLPF